MSVGMPCLRTHTPARHAVGIGLALLIACGAAVPLHAATVQLVPGAGFADPTVVAPEGGNTGTTLGQQRTNVFNAAAAVWGSALTSSQVIKIAASFSALTCSANSGVLGSAGATNFFALSDGTNTRFYPVALAESLTAMNLNGTDAEISASFNSTIDLNDPNCLGNTRWYYGLNGPVPANTIALFPVVLHELGHGLGFAALLCTNAAGCGATPYGGYFNGIPDVWADFLRDNDFNGSGGNRRWVDLTNAQRITAFTHDPLVVWDGMSVTANLPTFGQLAVGMNEGRLRMFAPNPFQPGSSISHFHQDASPNLLMEPSANANVFNQTDLADCLFADIGWPNSRCATVVNSAPTLNAISNPAPIPQNSGAQVVNLSGIGDGDASVAQELSVTASSGNTGLIPNPTVNYTNPNATGSLSYTPVAGQSGTAVITVTVRDDGGTANGGVDIRTRTFTVTVSPAANIGPMATNLSAPETYIEDSPLDLVNIVITDPDSPNVTATLTLSNPAAGALSTATSGAVTSTYVAATGVWTASGALANVNTLLAGVLFNPAANFNANFSIATSVSDGIAAAITGSKPVTGTPVNDPPTATNLSAAETYVEDTPLDLVNIVISDVDSPNVTATLMLSNPAAGALSTATSGAVTSTYVAATGVWTASGALANVNTLLAGVLFNPAANFNASFSIATSVSDGVAAAITGSKPVTGVAVNDPPTLNAIPNPPPIASTAGLQTVNLGGIGPGVGDPAQVLSVTATSNNPTLIPNPQVSYVSPASTGSISYTPVPGQSGAATITVTVMDNGGTANGGINQFSRSFTQQVNGASSPLIFANGFE